MIMIATKTRVILDTRGGLRDVMAIARMSLKHLPRALAKQSHAGLVEINAFIVAGTITKVIEIDVLHGRSRLGWSLVNK